MLGLDEEAINDLLGELSVNQLLNLIYAVEHNDREGASEIVKSASVDQNENEDDEREAIKTDAESRTRKPNVDDDDDETLDNSTDAYNVGDTVSVGGNEATVKIPSGPGSTVGVIIKGKLKMVDKSEITEDVGVLGMTGMPDLNRIRALAGMMSGPETPEPACDPACNPAADAECVGEIPCPVEVCPVDNGFGGDEVDADPAETCMAALQQIEAALPSVRLADLKAIRQRITAMVQAMNESLIPDRRPVAGTRGIRHAVSGGKNINKR